MWTQPKQINRKDAASQSIYPLIEGLMVQSRPPAPGDVIGVCVALVTSGQMNAIYLQIQMKLQ